MAYKLHILHSMKILYSILLTLLVTNIIVAQNSRKASTIQLYPKGNEIGLPVIVLNNQKALQLEFDILGEDAPYLYFEIQHFNFDWTKQDLNSLDFITGFSTGSIDNYEFSFNTSQLYTHYQLEFPNEQTKFKASGNYKILVYEDDPENILFEKRFYVTEQSVQIAGVVDNSISASSYESEHEISFTVDYRSIQANNPRNDFKANVQQNQRLDNELKNIEVTRMGTQQLIFDNPFKQTMLAGNEFRWFNTESIRYKNEAVAEIMSDHNPVDVWLYPDQPRYKSKFIEWNDYNGQYVINFKEGRRPDIEADYVNVHFTFENLPNLAGKEVYVFGALTDWQIKPEAKLNLNARQNLLESTLFLKQGNYDYQYLVKDGNQYTVVPTEGSFYRTENNYIVYCYYSPFGARFDRLVGLQVLSSNF